MPYHIQPFWHSIVFRLVLLSVILSLQGLLYYRATRWAKQQFPRHRWVAITTRGLFFVFNASFVLLILTRPQILSVPLLFRVAGVYPFYIWFGSTFLLALFLIVTGVLELPFAIFWRIVNRIHPARKRIEHVTQAKRFVAFDASRRVFLRRGMAGISAAAFLGNTYGVIAAKEVHDITEVSFPLDDLDPAFDGFTIGLITDVHSSVFMTRDDMDEYVSLTNSLNADLLVVDGDFVTSYTEEVYPFAESFEKLHAPHGVYGVMGNHDFYVANPDIVEREVSACGIHLLHDDRATITRGDAHLHVLGIDDTGSPVRAEERMSTALGTKPLIGPRILLCHRPYYLAQANAKGIDLVLSGHTHGGQIVLASLGSIRVTPAALASPYISGTYHEGKTAMYVSRGVGTVGLPIRINCPPEITRITLHSRKLEHSPSSPIHSGV